MRPPGGLRCAASTASCCPASARPVMGSCVAKEFFTRVHKEQPMVGPPPMAPRETHQPPVPPEKDNDEKLFQGSSSILSSSDATPSAYHVTALATSSLVGLVQTIKDHVTKPTAMARGRVAHLIEWKGWSAPQADWERALTDEERYDELTDELKEARFAAGVAEQFAITEATLSAWSSLDEDELGYGGLSLEAVQLQDLGSLYLQENYLRSPWGISGTPTLGGSLPAFSPSSHGSPVPGGHTTAKPCDALQDGLEKPPPRTMWGEQGSVPGSLRLQHSSSTSLRYVDSSSLSEDDVFYD